MHATDAAARHRDSTQSAEVAIRHGTADDHALLAELGARTFRDTFAANNAPEDMAMYLAHAFTPEKQAAELADPSSSFLIAEVGGVPTAPSTEIRPILPCPPQHGGGQRRPLP